ncbi:PEPxxWA-CTERM sorting domain-containing protein, partial [Sphingomonas sp.]|uniref:PEPxxWA-CTERM sorting domain-containing protein n=1 Tax=Sphingomonas sp. TaxID=28214 RepID=UPI002DB853EC
QPKTGGGPVMVRTVLVLSIALLASAPVSAAVLMDSAPTAPANRPALPPSPSGAPRGHVMIENFENTIKDDMIFASYGAPSPAPAAEIVANADVTAVPEPATWAMMLGGFGLAGAVLRRGAIRTTASLLR